MRIRWTKALLAGLSLTCMWGAHAAWPDKPVKLVVPYAAGGAADALARMVARNWSSVMSW